MPHFGFLFPSSLKRFFFDFLIKPLALNFFTYPCYIVFQKSASRETEPGPFSPLASRWKRFNFKFRCTRNDQL